MPEVQLELHAMLRKLHLSGMADNFGDLALKAANTHLTYETYLAEVVHCECVLREQRRIARLLRQSGHRAVRQRAGRRRYPDADHEHQQHRYEQRDGHFDQPIPVQFGTYIGKIAQGDLGASIKTSVPNSSRARRRSMVRPPTISPGT